jgi:uncharacterized protein GlcG (DUF336 family)
MRRHRQLTSAVCVVLAASLGVLAESLRPRTPANSSKLQPRMSLPMRDPPEPGTAPTLSAAQVDTIVSQAAASLSDTTLAIAVVDRPGNVLAIFLKPGALASDAERALSLARTGAIFSNDQAPLSSRTVRFISGIHFPPGIPFTPAAALYGIENTNRGCDLNVTWIAGKDFPRATAVDGVSLGLGVTTGKVDSSDSVASAVNPGGIPIYLDGRVGGGVGVAGVGAAKAEYAAFTGAAGFRPTPADPGVIYLDGILLPFVEQTTLPAGSMPGTLVGAYVVGPFPGAGAPEGWLVGPTAGMALTAAEVEAIITGGIGIAEAARAAIRLPVGSRTRMVLAVGDLDGTILGLYRMADATVFSVDVAVAKARNVVYFSGTPAAVDLPGVPAGTAVSNRTVSFGAQPLYPSGISPPPGPFFDLFLYDTANPCTQGRAGASPNQNGVVFFPGSVPLYRAGALVGGFGVSGDGVDQDDLVASMGAAGYEAPESIRADQLEIGGARLPYLKFPRNPFD